MFIVITIIIIIFILFIFHEVFSGASPGQG